jgi:TPR repeat protein
LNWTKDRTQEEKMIFKKFLIIQLIILVGYCASSQAMTMGDDVDGYFQQIEAAASKGDMAAETCLGELYADGIGTAPDPVSAFQWYSKAAAGGDPAGKFRVAQAYIYGIGVKKDVANGLQMLDELANRGYAPAESALAALYLGGNGVKKDEHKALALYRHAASVDDYEAELRLGLFYHWGDYVKKDDTEAKRWLGKAANHKLYCLSSFGTLANFLINGYIKPLDPKRHSQNGAAANLRIKYIYKNGRAENAVILLSSGDPDEDQAWLDATRDAVLPPWPDAFHPKDNGLGFLIPAGDGGLSHNFIVSVRKAIDTAKVMPLNVLLHGTKGLGMANVSFDYLDGKATNVKVVSSSDDVDEDAAAVSAIKHAKFGTTPKEYRHKNLHLTISIYFDYVSPTKAPPPTTAPSVSTVS